MFMNYMDYTVDGCKNIYTLGQRNRMRAVFANGGPRADFLNNYFRLNDLSTNAVCTTTNITATNPMCLPITWSISGPATIQPNGNTATITRNGDGTATVTATAGGFTDSKTIIIGIPLVDFSVQPNNFNQQFCTNSFGNWIKVEPQPVNGVTGFEWGYSSAGNGIPPTVYNANGTYDQDFIFSVGGNYQIYARAKNDCGLGTTETIDIFVFDNCNGGGFSTFSVSPNPTSGDVQVSATDATTMIKEIRVSDKIGTIKRRFVYNLRNKAVKINLSSLPADVYYLQIFDGTKWSTKSIIKK
jgi:hypothetical protein